MNNAIVFAALILETRSGFPGYKTIWGSVNIKYLKKKKVMYETWCVIFL